VQHAWVFDALIDFLKHLILALLGESIESTLVECSVHVESRHSLELGHVLTEFVLDIFRRNQGPLGQLPCALTLLLGALNSRLHHLDLIEGFGQCTLFDLSLVWEMCSKAVAGRSNAQIQEGVLMVLDQIIYMLFKTTFAGMIQPSSYTVGWGQLSSFKNSHSRIGLLGSGSWWDWNFLSIIDLIGIACFMLHLHGLVSFRKKRLIQSLWSGRHYLRLLWSFHELHVLGEAAAGILQFEIII